RHVFGEVRTDLLQAHEIEIAGIGRTTKTAAHNAGLIDSDGKLTEKGRAANGEQAPAAPRRAPIPAYHRLADGYELVTVKYGKSVADLPEGEVRALLNDLTRPRMSPLKGEEREAAARDAQRLEAELSRRAQVQQAQPQAPAQTPQSALEQS